MDFTFSSWTLLPVQSASCIGLVGCFVDHSPHWLFVWRETSPRWNIGWQVVPHNLGVLVAKNPPWVLPVKSQGFYRWKSTRQDFCLIDVLRGLKHLASNFDSHQVAWYCGKANKKHPRFHQLFWTIMGWLLDNDIWLVVGPPLWKILVNWDDYSQYMGNKKCSKPPTRYDTDIIRWGAGIAATITTRDFWRSRFSMGFPPLQGWTKRLGWHTWLSGMVISIVNQIIMVGFSSKTGATRSHEEIHGPWENSRRSSGDDHPETTRAVDFWPSLPDKAGVNSTDLHINLVIHQSSQVRWWISSDKKVTGNSSGIFIRSPRTPVLCGDPNAIRAPSPSHQRIFISGMGAPFPVMGGLWHCFIHIIEQDPPISQYFHYWIDLIFP